MAKRVTVIGFCVLGGFLVMAGASWGAVFEVSTASELHNALDAAESNGEDDTIRVAQGTYYGNFNYFSTEGKSITLLGGYTADFSSRTIDPLNTILDGADGGIRLGISNYSNGGDIFVQGFTIKGGTSTSDIGGISAYSTSYAPNASGSGNVTLANNIIMENTATYIGGGGRVASSSSSGPSRDVKIINNIITNNVAGTGVGGIEATSSCTSSDASGNVIFTNNFVSGNTANAAGGGIYVTSYSSTGQTGVVTVTNNTITGNSAAGSGGGAYISTWGTVHVYNNIIWGNSGSGGSDISVWTNQVSNGYNNDYSGFSGTWTNSGGNIDADPQFVGGGDYHLQSSSPCIDAGENLAPEIPSLDYDGDPRISDGDGDGTATVDMGADEYYFSRDDFIATWDGQGVYFRNSETEKWTKLASPANLIAAGDLDGEGKDDLIAIFPGTAGVWVRSSSTGKWAKLSSTKADHISSGDMNGDKREDLVATWDGLGVYYRDSISGLWTKLAQPAKLLAAGDLDGDNADDLIAVFPTPAGVWVRYSQTGKWVRLSSSSARDIASGDMNGDGRDDLLGSWDGTGVFYRNSISGAWVKMDGPAGQVTCGDLDGDGIDDLIVSKATAGGAFVKSSKTGLFSKLSAAAKDIATGVMRGAAWGGRRF